MIEAARDGGRRCCQEISQDARLSEIAQKVNAGRNIEAVIATVAIRTITSMTANIFDPVRISSNIFSADMGYRDVVFLRERYQL